MHDETALRSHRAPRQGAPAARIVGRLASLLVLAACSARRPGGSLAAQQPARDSSAAAPGGTPVAMPGNAAGATAIPAHTDTTGGAPTTHMHERTAPTAHAARRRGPIAIDGRLDETAWADATPITTFRQTQPLEGPPATQRTEVRVLFDDEAIYVGARMYDSLGGRGVHTRLARRDDQLDLDNGGSSQLTSDKLTVTLDPYHDHLTRAVFEINPSGVTGDALGAGGSNLDPSWDPVWQGAARVDSLGWTAEIRIPFSQLRFARDSGIAWGLQLVRVIDRLNERDQWSFYRKAEAGGPSRFGHLEGIAIHGRPRDVELLPYALVSDEANGNFRGDPANPVNRVKPRVGADVRYQLTNGLTLDATVNPDFGQVELDPAVINLSAYETFYPEKRPFFVSGASAFDYGGFSCFFCSNTSSLGLFYSRRIGRVPELANYLENLSTTTTSDVPANTQILGAAKVTGRTSGGLTVGLLDAVTNEERASWSDSAGAVHHLSVEPASNYLVARAKQDIASGATVIGGMVTSTLRDLDAPLLRDSLHTHAEAAGVDFVTTWDTRNYSLMGSGALSDVGGSAQAIGLTERSSAHYFQRPDRRHTGGGFFGDRFDTTATSLRGYAGYLRLAKDNGNWIWEVQENLRSPGFEVNDLAFQRTADYQQVIANLQRQWTVPGSWYRGIYALIGSQRSYDFDGDLIQQQYQTYFEWDWLNFWSLRLFAIHRPSALDPAIARGGPTFKSHGYNDAFVGLSTDSRRVVVVNLNVEGNTGINDPSQEINPQVTVLVKPASFLTVSLSPTLDAYRTGQQYDTTLAAAPGDSASPRVYFGNRYILASLVQTTLSVEARINMALTPKLTFSLYAQPLLASGHYYAFKEFDHTRQLHKTVDPSTTLTDGTIALTPAGSSTTYQLPSPDFNVRSLRGNAVLRWEYLPGSTLYLVWQQVRANDTLDGPPATFALNRDRLALFRSTPDDTFILKVSYWIGH